MDKMNWEKIPITIGRKFKIAIMSLLRYESQVRAPLVIDNKDYHQVTEDICRPVEARPTRLWWIGFSISVLFLCFGIVSVTMEEIYGVGQWNLNKTVGWGWDITNFVWWIGIGHAGTLISAILLLFRQGWRTGVNRAAEAMTIFAVICARQFPIWHMGREWFVSFDFATSLVPGWHTTIFPPYFVAGAIFSGFAMVQTLLVVTRKVLALEEYITIEHIDVMNKVIVLTGSIVGIAYLTELFVAWYGANPYENFAFMQNRLNLNSPYGWAYWIMMGCNVLSPQLFWFRKMRRNLAVTFFMSILVNIGMWFERFVIIVTSVYRDYLPSAWSTYYRPTIWEVGFYLGTFGLFFTCFFLFAKFFPVIAAAEIKHLLKRSGEKYKQKMDELEHEPLEEFVERHSHDHGA